MRRPRRRRALTSEQNFRRIRRQMRYRHSAARRLFRGSVLRRSLSAAKTGQERQPATQENAFNNCDSLESSFKVLPRQARSDFTRRPVIAVLQQNYDNIAALEPLAEREARLRWHGIV